MFNRPRLASLALATLLGLVAGCGSAPAKVNPMLEIVAGYSQQGQQYFEGKDYKAALASYEKALQLDRSIENADGIALNLLNIAQIHLVLNQIEAAQATLDELLENVLGLFQTDQLAMAATQKAIIHIRQGQPERGNEWINKADEFCGDSCLPKGLILNVQARLALDGNQPDAAIDLANRALAIHQKAIAVAETANSLRLIGESHLAKQLSDKAAAFFQEALQLDKHQGLPAKISIDLLLLGMAHKGSPELAAVFFKRALAVSMSAGDTEGARRAGDALSSISCQTRQCN